MSKLLSYARHSFTGNYSYLTECTSEDIRAYMKSKSFNFVSFIRSKDDSMYLILDPDYVTIGVIKKENLKLNNNEALIWGKYILDQSLLTDNRIYSSKASCYRRYVENALADIKIYDKTTKSFYQDINTLRCGENGPLFTDLFLFYIDTFEEYYDLVAYRLTDNSYYDFMNKVFEAGFLIDVNNLKLEKRCEKLLIGDVKLCNIISELVFTSYYFRHGAKLNLMEYPNALDIIKKVSKESNKTIYERINKMFSESDTLKDNDIFAFSLATDRAGVEIRDIVSSDLLDVSKILSNDMDDHGKYFDQIARIMNNMENVDHIVIHEYGTTKMYVFPEALKGKHVSFSISENKSYYSSAKFTFNVGIGAHSKRLKLCTDKDLEAIIGAFSGLITKEEADALRCKYYLLRK